MSLPRLFVIVLNNSRKDDVLACLASLFQNDYKNLRVILVDNVSKDDSVEAIRREFPQVQLIPLTTNFGYAGNNNIGIQAALDQGADWIFILNDDTVLDPSCLSLLIETSERDPAIGIAGPLVYHFDAPKVIQSAGGMLGKYWQSAHLGKDELDCGQFKSARPVQWISGCAILVRRAVIEQVGMLDPNYFLYWEETEWCIRASHAGWKIMHIPQARLWHKGASSMQRPKPYVTYYTTRNQLFTLAKHEAPLRVWIFTLLRLFRILASWTLKPHWRPMREHRDAMWMGLVNFLQGRSGPMPS
jgi:GT2 family glycosyltransferase